MADLEEKGLGAGRPVRRWGWWEDSFRVLAAVEAPPPGWALGRHGRTSPQKKELAEARDGMREGEGGGHRMW